MKLSLRAPALCYQETFLQGYHELEGHHSRDADQNAWAFLAQEDRFENYQHDFSAFVQMHQRAEHEAPPNFVCYHLFWAIDSSGEMLGRISFRPQLNEFLQEIGGHIGYIVRPSARGKGVATEMLRLLLLDPVLELQERVLITCDLGNLASEKVILKNGGVFEKTVEVGEGRPPKKRFWIRL